MKYTATATATATANTAAIAGIVAGIVAGILAIARKSAQHTLGTFKAKVKKTLAVVPFGDGNAKVGTLSTYRPVGVTCPSACPHLGVSCYAEEGHVGSIQRFAAASWQEAVAAAVAAIVRSQLGSGAPVRLHTSGDFFFQDRLDVAYLEGLIEACKLLQAEFGSKIFAWTYTHAKPAAFEAYRQRLAAVGIVVRYSECMGPNSTTTVDPEDIGYYRQEAKKAGLALVVCPEQQAERAGKGLTCLQCRKCWEAPATVQIGFLLHGNRVRAGRERLARERRG